MQSIGKRYERCIQCDNIKTSKFYEWTGFIGKEDLGFVCEKCAIKHVFGSKFKQNKRYKRWKKKVEA